MDLAISPVFFEGVPLKIICSMRWVIPASSSVSLALPVLTHTWMAATGALRSCLRMTVNPLSNLNLLAPSVTEAA